MHWIAKITRGSSRLHERCLIAAILVIIVGGVFFVLRLQQMQIANDMRAETALVAAKSEMQTIRAFSDYYAKVIVPRAKEAGLEITHDVDADPHALPFPISMARDVSTSLLTGDRGETFRFYSDRPWKFRETGGPTDAFERRALDAFVAGDRGEHSEIVKDGETLRVRYARPMPMTEACLACHNTSADSPKTDWKVGDIRGALSISMKLPASPSILSFEGLHWSAIGFLVLIVSIIGPCIALLFGLVRAQGHAQREALSNDLDHAILTSKAKTDFLACTSHELRTPLNAIIGFSEMLTLFADTLPDAKKAEYARDIHRSGRHLLSFVDDILDLEKIENGSMELEERDVDLLDIVGERIALIEPVAARNRIRILSRSDRDVAIVRMDGRMMRQMLDNLLSNAIKFSHADGTVVVSVQRGKDGHLSVGVQDTGTGMDGETVARLFQPYTQADATVARRFGGTGLGLSIVKRQADMHGAAIRVRSAIGRGTRIDIDLPPGRIVETRAAHRMA